MSESYFSASVRDETMLAHCFRTRNGPLQSEQFDDSSHEYLNELIPKPWGHEFRIYADDLFDAWKLCLTPGQGTSLHCHPRKATALLCLSGDGAMGFFGRTRLIAAGEFVIIGRGVFHRTENTGTADLHLVEIEVPRNKFDLIRLEDRYGRGGAAYEVHRESAASILRPGLLINNSRLRDGVGLDGFRFGVSAGLELISNPVPGLLFAVSLSVADAVTQRITVLDPGDVRRAVHEQLYLTVQHDRTEE